MMRGTKNLLLAVLPLVLIACDSLVPGGGSQGNPDVAQLVITPATATVDVGSTIALVATAYDHSGVVLSPAPRVDWRSSNTSVASVATNGTVRGIAGGNPVTITATVRPAGPSQAAEVTVFDPAAPAEILVEPTEVTMLMENPVQLTATVLNGHGVELDVPITWTSNAPADVSVDANGLLSAHRLGANTWVSARSGRIQTWVRVVVLVPELRSVLQTPASATLQVGETLQILARPLTQSGQALDLALDWYSQFPDVASVDESGLVTALEPGTTGIRAGLGSVRGWTDLTVVAPTECSRPMPGASINQQIQGVQLLQATEVGNPGTGVPVVRNRPLLVRTVVTHDQGGTGLEMGSSLRLTVYSGATPDSSHTHDIECVGAEANLHLLQATANVIIPSAYLLPDMSILVELLAANGDVLDTYRYPAEGLPGLERVTPHPIHIEMVPVSMQALGSTAEVPTDVADHALGMTRILYPLGQVTFDVRDTPYLYTGNDNPSNLLEELRELQLLEGRNSYYHGILPAGHFFDNIDGFGYIGLPTAWSSLTDTGLTNPDTVAHELGHNFSLYHVDCGPVDNPDPDYPYSDGQIGRYGYDHIAGELKLPSVPDLMSYCHPKWISDYHYAKVLQFRAEEAAAAAASLQPQAPGGIVVIGGSVQPDGTVQMRPLLHSNGHARPPQPGDWQLQLLATGGAVLAETSFGLHQLSHDDALAFSFSLPLAQESLDSLTTVRVLDPQGREVYRQSDSVLQAQAGGNHGLDVTRLGQQNVQVTWPAASYETVIVLDPLSGSVLARGSSGSLQLEYPGDQLDLLVSTGVQGGRYRVPVR